ncbi:uncharacterized protein [Centruroides vittatus]|uniref:uncharacterized protein n=1 Tax=Centruroides vittatus TaxID=120091 RepID=UPI00350F925B
MDIIPRKDFGTCFTSQSDNVFTPNATKLQEKSRLHLVSCNPVTNLTSGLSCNNKEDVRCAYGCIEERKYLKILNYNASMTSSKLSLYEMESKIRSTNWIRDNNGNYPELLMVSSHDLCIYEMAESDLILRTTVFEGNKTNRVEYCEWNPWNPTYVASLHANGECMLWSLQRQSKIDFHAAFGYDATAIVYNGGPQHKGMCFCDDTLQNCFLTYNGLNKCYLHDLRTPCSKYLGVFCDCIIDMKTSLKNPYYVGFIFKRDVKVLDIRYPVVECLKFNNFNVLDEVTSFAWSPNEEEMVIGTSLGECIIWNPEKNVYLRTKNDGIKCVMKISYHPLQNRTLLTASKSSSSPTAKRTCLACINVFKIAD